MRDLTSFASRLRERLEKEKDIVFAYLFGSLAQGKETPLSDVDIAIYISSDKDMAERREELTLKLVEFLDREKIDVVILNMAPPSLIHSVMATGKILFSRNESLRVSFLARNLREYLELARVREEYWRRMKERIEEGRFGIRESHPEKAGKTGRSSQKTGREEGIRS